MSVYRVDPAKKITSAELATQVIRLKRGGKTYDEISAMTGVDRSTCWRWVRDALKAATAERTAEAEIARTEQVERLEALLDACWSAAMEGSVPHIAEARRLVVAISDLHGIRQPIQFSWGMTDVERALSEVRRTISERAAGAGSAPHVIEGRATETSATLPG